MGTDDPYNHGRDWYDEVIGEYLEPVIDHVATQQEWAHCKAALLAWIAHHDADLDAHAVNSEFEHPDLDEEL